MVSSRLHASTAHAHKLECYLKLPLLCRRPSRLLQRNHLVFTSGRAWALVSCI
jgi:hypothetical protein